MHTSPFHGGNTSSNLVGDAKQILFVLCIIPLQMACFFLLILFSVISTPRQNHG